MQHPAGHDHHDNLGHFHNGGDHHYHRDDLNNTPRCHAHDPDMGVYFPDFNHDATRVEREAAS